MKARVTVYPRREILDPQGKAIRDALSRVGFAGVDDVRAGKSFEISLDGRRSRGGRAAAARDVREAARQHRGRGLRGGDPGRATEPAVKCGVVVFPGSNCDHDVYHVLKHVLEQEATFLWHQDDIAQGLRADRPPRRLRLRRLPAGRRARRPLAGDGRRCERHAEAGGLVLGICNGFQVLLEAGLLPGAMRRNAEPPLPLPGRLPAGRADGPPVHPQAARRAGAAPADRPRRGELRGLRRERARRASRRSGQVVFRYCTPDGGERTTPSEPERRGAGDRRHLQRGAATCSA